MPNSLGRGHRRDGDGEDSFFLSTDQETISAEHGKGRHHSGFASAHPFNRGEGLLGDDCSMKGEGLSAAGGNVLE